jgi:hypothetical protein
MVDTEEESLYPYSEPLIPPIIIFVIVICALFGLLLLVLGIIFVCKKFAMRRRSLIRMHNELQFKRGDTFPKYPLNKGSGPLPD